MEMGLLGLGKKTIFGWKFDLNKLGLLKDEKNERIRIGYASQNSDKFYFVRDMTCVKLDEHPDLHPVESVPSVGRRAYGVLFGTEIGVSIGRTEADSVRQLAYDYNSSRNVEKMVFKQFVDNPASSKEIGRLEDFATNVSFNPNLNWENLFDKPPELGE